MTYEQIVGEILALKLATFAMMTTHPNPALVRAQLAVLVGTRQTLSSQSGVGAMSEEERNAVRDLLSHLDALVAQGTAGPPTSQP